MQPPMNTFDYAYYDCEAGAFEIDYDSDTPTQATIITSNHNQKYALTRSASSSGVEFAGRGVKFWTDGKKVLVQGTSIPLAYCRLEGQCGSRQISGKRSTARRPRAMRSGQTLTEGGE